MGKRKIILKEAIPLFDRQDFDLTSTTGVSKPVIYYTSTTQTTCSHTFPWGSHRVLCRTWCNGKRYDVCKSNKEFQTRREP